MKLYVFELRREGRFSLHAYYALNAKDAGMKFNADVAPRNGDSWNEFLVTSIVTRGSEGFS
jgi:hypothetical protein